MPLELRFRLMFHELCLSISIAFALGLVRGY